MAVTNSLGSDARHFLCLIAGQYTDPTLGEETRIHTGAATDFQNAISRMKGLFEFCPDQGSLGQAD
jgi:hypothetical protein